MVLDLGAHSPPATPNSVLSMKYGKKRMKSEVGIGYWQPRIWQSRTGSFGMHGHRHLSGIYQDQLLLTRPGSGTGMVVAMNDNTYLL